MEAAHSEELVVTGARDVRPEVVTWIWEDYIPLAEIVIFSGNADVGKGCSLAHVVSCISSLRDFPTGPCLQGGEVLMLTAEDSKEKVVSRLIAAGAELESVHFIDRVEIKNGAKKHEREFALDTDVQKLEAYLKENPTVALITIDPISSYFGSGKMNDKQEVRRVMKPLQDLCRDYRVTIIGIEHFNKQVGQSAIHRVGGSVALTAAPRAAFMFAKDPDGEGYVMHHIKGNDAKRKVGLKYRIDGKVIEFDGKPVVDGNGKVQTVPFIIWEGEADGNADDFLKAEQVTREDSSIERAKRYLLTFTEPTLESDIREKCPANIGRDALNNAAKVLKFVKRPQGFRGPWMWYPPDVPAPDPARRTPPTILFPTHRDDDAQTY